MLVENGGYGMMGEEWVLVKGVKDTVGNKINKELGIDRYTVEKILTFLTKEKNILCDDEEFHITIDGGDDVEEDCNMLGLMIMENNYYINIRVATVFLLTVLIDNKIGLPIASGYFAYRGMNRLVERIEENSGIKCILLEILRTKDKIGGKDILKACQGECCNNDLACKFRNENSCTCQNEDVINILMQLTEIGILQKQNDYYKYNPIGIL